MKILRHGDIETYGHGDMEIWAWRHGRMDMETWTFRYEHGDMDMDVDMKILVCYTNKMLCKKSIKANKNRIELTCTSTTLENSEFRT